ncbi:hypothetical protein HYV85_06880 [Candidatus Woesearchaeota archaeon]|nr:hypothetical protein [Candidatus Woesearchaeota archaeon]
MQKIVCHKGKCRDIGKTKIGIYGKDISGMIESDLLRGELGDELGDSYDGDEW